MSLAEETEAGASPTGRLLELIDERLPADRAPAVRAFAQAYLRRLSGDASEGISPDHLLAEIGGAWDDRLAALERQGARRPARGG